MEDQKKVKSAKELRDEEKQLKTSTTDLEYV